MTRIDQLPAVLTSFAYREEYFPELEEMTSTVRKHHPDWWVVTGKGPLPGFDGPALEVQSPIGKFQWQLPVTFQLDGTENDWLRIVRMKGWWVSQVWHHVAAGADAEKRRVVWLDADARLNGPLDIVLNPEDEIVAGPWPGAEGTPDDHMCSGLLVFQGKIGGTVETIINQWSSTCISYIENPPPPSPIWIYGEGDQEVLSTIVKNKITPGMGYTLCKLDYDKYCGEPNYKNGDPKPGALVDQWMMNEKMRLPKDRERLWPPPEQARRRPVS